MAQDATRASGHHVQNGDEAPDLILNLEDLEKSAIAKMPKPVREYFNSGATYQSTVQSNLGAFRKFFLRPRVLVDVSQADTTTEVFGRKMPFPVCVSPTALHKLAHPDGELATARGCAAAGVNMGLSSYSSTLWEDCISQGSGIDFAIQMYTYPDRGITRSLIKKSEALGCKCILLTGDSPVHGARWNETRNNIIEHLGPRISFPNLTAARVSSGQAVGAMTAKYQDASQNWDREIPFLRSITKMKIFIKGVLTAEDTLRAIECGVDGILVSNHGGRQLDGVPASLDALVECVEAARGRIAVHFDGGVRSGTDVFKAIAIGADCVWVGRPALWGLAHDGEKGVELMLKILRDEFLMTMQLMGCTSIKDITRKRLSVMNASGFLTPLDVARSQH